MKKDFFAMLKQICHNFRQKKISPLVGLLLNGGNDEARVLLGRV